ncbi:hypothetical protein NDU88_004141 [Pleurodeles waltl]|uniref:Uncharacterized protein n=1 Tax=Pleurodeles waltl TaxID=8319 RepID=A0AAV7WWU5_PLEWA|nr:hypothetical protein NDU88_004141 [Pleurodeles waltl]
MMPAAIQESKTALQNQIEMLAGEGGLLREDHNKLKDRVKTTEDIMSETTPQENTLPGKTSRRLEMDRDAGSLPLGKEDAKAWTTDKKKRKGAGARMGPATVPSQEQIKTVQMKAVRDLRGTTEIRLSNRWRELAADTGGTGTEQSGSETESEMDQPPQVNPITADLLG